jgi:hypothetical protein
MKIRTNPPTASVDPMLAGSLPAARTSSAERIKEINSAVKPLAAVYSRLTGKSLASPFYGVTPDSRREEPR